MDRRSGSERKELRTAAGYGSSSSGGDRITALPLELRAQIASLLSFDETVQMTVLSRPWRHIHLHTPVVEINLTAFLSVRGLLDEDAILSVRVALGRRRAQDASSSSKVDTLKLFSDIDDHRMMRHAARIIALADARVIRFQAPFLSDDVKTAWTLDLPAAARELVIVTRSHLAPAIATGPGAAALRKLRLDNAVLTEWPRLLPSLVSLDLNSVKVKAPFAPGDWCPLLDELDVFCCEITHARVDIRMSRLRFLDMDSVDVGRDAKAAYGVITIDAPELIEFDIVTAAGGTTDFKSFTLQAGQRQVRADQVYVDLGIPDGVFQGAGSR